MKGDFAPCTFFDQWDQCLDSNGDGVQVKFLVKLHTISSWSPKMSVLGDCGLTQVPQMPNEKMIFDFVQPSSILNMWLYFFYVLHHTLILELPLSLQDQVTTGSVVNSLLDNKNKKITNLQNPVVLKFKRNLFGKTFE